MFSNRIKTLNCKWESSRVIATIKSAASAKKCWGIRGFYLSDEIGAQVGTERIVKRQAGETTARGGKRKIPACNFSDVRKRKETAYAEGEDGLIIHTDRPTGASTIINDATCARVVRGRWYGRVFCERRIYVIIIVAFVDEKNKRKNAVGSCYDKYTRNHHLAFLSRNSLWKHHHRHQLKWFEFTVMNELFNKTRYNI